MQNDSTSMLDRKILELLKAMEPDEKKVYWEACLEFGENRTFQNTAEPLRSRLMHDFGKIAVDRYSRNSRGRRRRRSPAGV